jgi:hypothetical protein
MQAVYVAAVWNTYRKTHIMILDIMIRCSKYLGLNDNFLAQTKAIGLAEDIAASIPYHLTNDVRKYVRRIHDLLPTKFYGRPVGGLLILHPLWVVANSSIISRELQHHMRKQLSWIGKNMGIGQATLLANENKPISFQLIAQGHVLIWAGMLIQPI